MKHMIITLIILTSLFANEKNHTILAKSYKVKSTQSNFTILCIDGYEWILDPSGKMHQSYIIVKNSTISVPKECK